MRISLTPLLTLAHADEALLAKATLPAVERTRRPPPRARAALVVRLGEKRILAAAVRETRTKMRRVVRGVRRLALRSTDGERGACPQSMSVQSPWIQKLLGERERVERCDEAVSLLSRKIHAALPTGDIALLDAAGAPFLWMTNTVGRLPNGDKSNANRPMTWPWPRRSERACEH